MKGHRILPGIVAVLAYLSVALGAADVPESVRQLPVQYQGRNQPFASFARDHVLLVTGKWKWQGEDPSATVLTWLAHPDRASSEPLIEVGFDPLRQEAGLDMKRRRFSLDELLAARQIMNLAQRSAQVKAQDGKPTKVESEAEKVLNRMSHLWALITWQVPGWVPVTGEPGGQWRTLEAEAVMGDTGLVAFRGALLTLLKSYQTGDQAGVEAAARRLGEMIRDRWRPDPDRAARFASEVRYNRWHPVQIGRALYLAALLLLLGSLAGWASRLVPAAHVVLTAGFLSHLVGLALRWHIGARAPWSNFYESLVTLTAVLVLFGIIFARRKLRAYALGGAAFAGYFALLIADRAGLSPAVDTLVPALQSYWLSIHVIVILSGYAVAALAMILGHVALGVEALKPADRGLFIGVTNAIYRAVQMAMLLLFAGTILGGVWAHEAWGRYWGWDPKETWALISWFGYLAVAHARFAGWLSPRGLAMAAIGVFPLILMTYYGVNYLLSGLHSYAGGESASVPPLLVGFLALEAVVLAAAWRGWHLLLFRKVSPQPAAK